MIFNQKVLSIHIIVILIIISNKSFNHLRVFGAGCYCAQQRKNGGLNTGYVQTYG